MIHLPTLARRILCGVLGRPILSDSLRNGVYAWAMGYVGRYPHKAALLDVGSRNSLFPAFCAKRGYAVSLIDPDSASTAAQEIIARRWGVALRTMTLPAHRLTDGKRCAVITALFSLQHAGDDDIIGLERCCSLLAPGGTLLVVNECCEGPSRIQDQRVDGDMRIYSDDDIRQRITGVMSAAGLRIAEERRVPARGKGRRAMPGIVMIAGVKPLPLGMGGVDGD